jgi:hypothetical protein
LTEVLDDKDNIGVSFGTDIAGLEFRSIGDDKFLELFGYVPTDGAPTETAGLSGSQWRLAMGEHGRDSRG